MAGTLTVNVDLEGANRKLGEIARGLQHEVDNIIQNASGKIARGARGNVLSRPIKYPHKGPGNLQDSYYGTNVGVWSNVPQGPVWEFGGTIAPRGYPIHIPRSEFVNRAADQQRAPIEQELHDGVERLIDSVV